MKVIHCSLCNKEVIRPFLCPNCTESDRDYYIHAYNVSKDETFKLLKRILKVQINGREYNHVMNEFNDQLQKQRKFINEMVYLERKNIKKQKGFPMPPAPYLY